MTKRRSEIEIWRDILLALFYKRKPMKRTPLMFASGLTWSNLYKIIEDFEKKKIVKVLYYENLSRSDRNKYELDGRSREAIKITEKGKYVLRFIDSFLQYIDEGEADGLPPRWIMQRIFREKNPIIRLSNDGAITKLFPGIGSADLRCIGWISNPKINGPVHCPFCGKKLKNLRGLKSHAGIKHGNQFDLIMSLFEEYNLL